MKSKDNFIKLLNTTSLSFKDKQIEREFLTYYSNNIIGHTRLAMGISIGIYAAFAFLDVFLYPDFKAIFHEIRFFIVMPIILLVILYTFHPSAIKYLQLITSISSFVGSYGILAMLYIGGHEVSYLYYVGLMLVFIFNYDFLKLRFINASIVGNLTLVGYLIIALLIGSSISLLVASMFFLIAANIMGMVSAYFYEHLSRKYFYSNLLLEKEKEKTIEMNLNLEAQVNERTSKLEKANKELYESKILAEESERLKSVFLATMSHELRTPLNAIIGFSDFITSGENDAAENTEFAQLINKSGQHLLSLVESLFDITMIDSGQVKLNMDEFKLQELLADVASIMQQEKAKLGKSAIDLKMIEGNINPDFTIFTDGNKIKQGLINLLKNALKFTETGEVVFWCDEITIHDKSYLKFYVRDTGIGIPADKLHLIFDVFRQVDDSHSRRYGGVGIGLSVVRKLVYMLDGEVGVDSLVGEGSTFSFTIGNYARLEMPTKNSTVKIPDISKYTNKKILVVEDDDSSFQLLQVLLKKMGFDVVWAQNGAIALNILEEDQKFTLILMDLNMPVLNGYDTTARIKRMYPEQIIIAQTAYAVSGDREKALAAGCNAYITKPISANRLQELIGSFISVRA